MIPSRGLEIFFKAFALLWDHPAFYPVYGAGA